MNESQSSIAYFDTIVVGAGFSGLYALYKLREKGMNVCVLEAGTGVGGTWYWNRYPGARTDSQSYLYQYWFSDELLEEWNWSERFPAQEETERYLNFVADKFDLRKDIKLSARVNAADFDETSQRWLVTTEGGDKLSAQFLIMGTGGLTESVLPNIPGINTFKGESHHTAQWPKAEVDFTDKRVGIIGTGATGIQVVQTIGGRVGHLTVFQRTPNYTIPMRNPKYDNDIREELRSRYPEMKHKVFDTFGGFDYSLEEREFSSCTPAERRALYEELWADGSLSFWIGSFGEMFVDEEANREVSAFVREKIRARINDPRLADKLVPSEHGFGTRRVPLETKYYEVFNQDNVDLVDTNEMPIECITEAGIRTSEGEIPLDIIIYATGFDAGTGALTRIDVRGRDGKLLKDTWDQEVRTFMGLQIHGYPNMFTTMAPLSPAAAYCNVPTCVQQQVDWISECMMFVRAQSGDSIEPTLAAQDAWVAHHDEIGSATLSMKTRSWHVRRDTEGNQQRVLAYAGGADAYRKLCDEVTAGGYKGMRVTRIDVGTNDPKSGEVA